MKITNKVNESKVDLSDLKCQLSEDVSAACFTLETCFQYLGKGLPATLGMTS